MKQRQGRAEQELFPPSQGQKQHRPTTPTTQTARTLADPYVLVSMPSSSSALQTQVNCPIMSLGLGLPVPSGVRSLHCCFLSHSSASYCMDWIPPQKTGTRSVEVITARRRAPRRRRQSQDVTRGKRRMCSLCSTPHTTAAHTPSDLDPQAISWQHLKQTHRH